MIFQIAGSSGGVSSPGMVSLNSVGTASPAGTPAPPAVPSSPTQQQQEQEQVRRQIQKLMLHLIRNLFVDDVHGFKLPCSIVRVKLSLDSATGIWVSSTKLGLKLAQNEGIPLGSDDIVDHNSLTLFSGGCHSSSG